MNDSCDIFPWIFLSDAWFRHRRRHRFVSKRKHKHIENLNRFESLEEDWEDKKENLKLHYPEDRHNDDDDDEGL